MPDDVRMVAIAADQFALLEEIGTDMLRDDYERAYKILAICLAWRWSPQAEHGSSADLAAAGLLGRPPLYVCEGELTEPGERPGEKTGESQHTAEEAARLREVPPEGPDATPTVAQSRPGHLYRSVFGSVKAW